MVGVAGGAVTKDLGVNLRPPGLGVVQLLQQEDARALSHDKAAALRVKGNGGPAGVHRLGQGLHGGKAPHGQRRQGRLAAAAEARVGIAVPDGAEGVPHGVGAPGAGGNRAGAHSPEARVNGHPPGGHVADACGNEEGRHPVPPPGQPPVVLLLRDADAANAAGNHDAAAFRVGLFHPEATVRQGLPGGGQGKLGKAPHALGLHLPKEGVGVEALDLCGQLDLHASGIVGSDGPNAAHALPDGPPAPASGKAQGSNGPQARDDDSPSFHSQTSYHIAMPPSTASTCPVI